ncbi:MAG: TIGR03032 family protein, partial [Alphaproteobacteria bacterium]
MSESIAGIVPVSNPIREADPSRGVEAATITYSVSPGFVGLLARLNISVALTSYQSGKFYLLGRNPAGGLMVHERLFQKAMGLCVAGNSLVLATLFQLMRFENVLEKGQFINRTYDACYVPRLIHTTGVLDAHDVGLTNDGEVIFVNTRYNCLATTSAKHSFTALWKPPFITQIIDEDRCHLNGLAMENGCARYVTAVSRSNTIDGWRDRRANGGIVLDVASGDVVCGGLSMPHSPRLAGGRLWVLNSGTGELGHVDGQTFQPVAFCPGFVRGLAFCGDYAFVGLSKPRYSRFAGLPLDERLQAADSEPWCGIQVINISSGACTEWFRIDGAIAEIYDVGVIAGVACPMALGFASDDI